MAVSTRLRNRPLGVVRGPVLTNTVVSLLSSHESIKKSFKGWHLSALDVMKMEVNAKMYDISNNALLSDPPEGEQSDIQPRKLRPAGNLVFSRPSGVLSTSMIYGLAVLLSAVLTTLAVLYWYSQHGSLSQTAFVYEARVKIAGPTYGKLAPYSIVPTLLAVAIGLWWASMDAVFRQAQPFIDQARAPIASRSGSGMSYQSTYLLWAAFRALLRHYWLLALVSTGAFLAQILTIAMSALWTRQSWQQTAVAEAFQPLQLRQMPLVHQAYASRRTRNGAYYLTNVMANVFNNLQTNWMYSAAIQLTLNGSEPPWSSDRWGFVPVDLVSASKVRETQQVGSDGNLTSAINAKIGTPAIRARLECTSWNELQAVQWLTEYDLTNATKWNTTVNPKSFEKAFALGCDDDGRLRFINFQPNTSSSATACEYLGGITEFRAGGETITCCTSGSGDDPRSASIGIWSPSYHQGQYFGGWPFLTWPTNITVKWITGRAFSAYPKAKGSTPVMLWPEAPRIAAIDCTPIIEMANATVKVSAANSAVQSYHILDDPKPDESAWANAFDQYAHANATADSLAELNVNFTTSYGVMFLEALLGSSSMGSFAGCGLDDCGVEILGDKNFNIRLPGLNVDYMTYSMLSLAQNDSTIMLDPATLTALTKRTFSTFFQHFASMDVALDGDGGWVYQKANATLPAHLGKPTSIAVDSLVPEALVNGSEAHSILPQFTNETTTISTERPIEILRMSPLAVGLCLGILIWLIGTCVLVLILKKRYFLPLLSKVESVADVAVLIAGSERLFEFCRMRKDLSLFKLTRLSRPEWAGSEQVLLRCGGALSSSSLELSS